MESKKRAYHSPELKKYRGVEEMPAEQRAVAGQLVEEATRLSTVVDQERRWVSVTEAFACLLGYRTMEMIGKRVDDFTAEDSVDIDFAFKALFRLGEMDGVWIFNRKDGKKVVVHYHARFSSGYSHSELKPLLIA